jgi:hypothetical protein
MHYLFKINRNRTCITPRMLHHWATEAKDTKLFAMWRRWPRHYGRRTSTSPAQVQDGVSTKSVPSTISGWSVHSNPNGPQCMPDRREWIAHTFYKRNSIFEYTILEEPIFNIKIGWTLNWAIWFDHADRTSAEVRVLKELLPRKTTKEKTNPWCSWEKIQTARNKPKSFQRLSKVDQKTLSALDGRFWREMAEFSASKDKSNTLIMVAARIWAFWLQDELKIQTWKYQNAFLLIFLQFIGIQKSWLIDTHQIKK